MLPSIRPYNVLIPAAGNSSRMGSCKSLLLRPEGTSFLSHLITFYQSLHASEIIVVVQPGEFDLLTKHIESTCFADRVKIITHPDVLKGRFISLQIGIIAFTRPLPLVIHNIDNPYTNDKLIYQLITSTQSGSTAIPAHAGQYGHPVCIGTNIQQIIRETDATSGNLQNIIQNHQIQIVQSPDEGILLNLNSQEAYDAFFRKNQPLA